MFACVVALRALRRWLSWLITAPSIDINVDQGEGDLGYFMCYLCVHNMGRSLPTNQRARCMYYILYCERGFLRCIGYVPRGIAR